ncbi:energy transducer TonB [Saprospira grandis]|uniref:TonB family protein n=1 Tax=Saprospira grandis (strain Lewin) TaxID=984262 RepID=H6KZQ7_SAPGL|nr:energy transducer TonB [Saprospira grandis]AFC25833.1 TonB family protein [Saprospira grandis str. Lewin]
MPYYSLFCCLLFSATLWAQENRPALFPSCSDPLISLAQQEDCSRKKLLEYIHLHCPYPDTALQEEVEGLVVAAFEVDEEGQIAKVKILKGVNKAINEAVMQTLRGIKGFQPALKDGQASKSWIELPIRFQLNKLLDAAQEKEYQLLWSGPSQSNQLKKKELKTLLQNESLFVRSIQGQNFKIQKLEITYWRKKKLRTIYLKTPKDFWTEEVQNLLKEVRRKGKLFLRAHIQDRYEVIVVQRDLELI